ncbi:transmembrane protein 165-like isoform X10 [Homarus americanus]|uniref:transmembrane protein 165-like isoform X10 n=1 Tax=Homarus americanus TaxID=6706 RepID=UPI001C456B43|nr:transmembrane protein 165-like isoform X10 [Homarus americanus]
MSRIVWVVTLTTLFLGVVWADFHPIDVEPVMKKEQPDFEDDTGNGAVVHSGSGDRFPNSSHDTQDKKDASDVNFLNAFIAALSMIIVTELGDKTFFIAAIMAMNHPRVTVFSGAMFALAIMHMLSAMFGYVITWIPRVYTFYASSVLFAIFGLKMLREGWKMKPDEGQEELEEVQSDLRRREDDYRHGSVEEGAVTYSADSVNGDEAVLKQESPKDGEVMFPREGRSLEESGAGSRRGGRKRVFVLQSRIFLQAFTMTFLAEWGDRSQIATVVMAAREDVSGVIVGGLLGHFLCTGLAVVGGRIIAARISIRTVTIIGGITFLIFAASALIIGP